MNWWPMHSWHPLVVHLPLVGLVVAVAFDLAASRNRSARWRDAATVLQRSAGGAMNRANGWPPNAEMEQHECGLSIAGSSEGKEV